MWQKIILLTFLGCFVVVGQNIPNIPQKSYYTIVGSNQVRPNSNYVASVTVHGEPVSCTIQLSIEDADNNYKRSRSVIVFPFMTQTVRIPTGDMVPSEHGYKLIAEGTHGIIFKNETTLHLNQKKFSVFIQTDKGMYKPEDLIRFRVLILNEFMKPATINGDLNIIITDGGFNRVKQWNGVRTFKGVYSNSLQLSEYPVLGNWNIIVETMGETRLKTIQVAEYVLPKFEAIIDTPARALWTDGVIRVKVSGIYTYGHPVRGTATVSIKDKYGYFPEQEDNALLQKVVPVEDSAIVEFNIDDINLDSYRDIRDFEITLSLEEELTGKIQTAKYTVTLYVDKFNIENISPSSTFKPGLPFEVFIKVTNYDNTPIIDSTNQIKVFMGSDHIDSDESIDDNDLVTSKDYPLDKSGIVSFSLAIPANETGVYISAEYLGQRASIGYFNSAKSLTGAFLQATVTSGTPALNKIVTIEVKSNQNMGMFTYQILGRGNILLSRTILVPNRKVHSFSIKATLAMVPKAHVVIFYLKDGEIISTHLDLTFSEELENKITITSSVDEAKPGESVNFTVTTTAKDSFVGLLGIDQSVLILKPGFDLAYSNIFDELDQYNNDYYPPYFPIGEFQPVAELIDEIEAPPALDLVETGATSARRRRSITSWYLPFSPWEDFNEAGALILSNANYMETSNDAEHTHSEISQNVGAGSGMTRVRRDFPETWIWDEFNNFPGSRVLNKPVPDTITSWIVTGFSVSPTFGIGITKDATKLQVFKPFFVSLDLPYSIKRGETVAIQIVVFNYMSSEVNAEVTLSNEKGEFEFDDSPTVTETAGENIRKKTISISASDGTGLSFLIRSKIVGPLTIKVSAITDLAGDTMERILPVEPEGTPQFINQALFIDLRGQSSYQTSISVAIPSNAVPDSTRVEVSAIGDILGVTLKNLDNLIRMPYGCGEQNMVGFVPNIVAIDYLKNTNQLTGTTEARAKNFMESGYQRQLSYAHANGSFSAFGTSDPSGSTWLTAYVVRSFVQASKYIQIDGLVIERALTWLSGLQAENGSFPEPGQVSHKAMQGGATNGVALTAYTLIAFIENKDRLTQFQKTINKAVAYILEYATTSDDIYSLALATYALQLVEHPSRSTIYDKFQLLAQQDKSQNWWTRSNNQTTSQTEWSSKPSSVDVEMTAYGLLSTLIAGTASDALPIVRWLLSKRNEQGGYESTQDTVVGMTALASFGKLISNKANNVRLSIKYSGKETKSSVTASNALVLQQYPLPSSVSTVDISATGKGFALVQVSYSYNLDFDEPTPRFNVKPIITEQSTVGHLLLSVCANYIPLNNQNTSNMAVMEVELPTGYTADLDQFVDLKSTTNVKRVETKKSNTIVVIYFDNFGIDEICPLIGAHRTNKVANQKSVAVKVYDYYENSQSACTFYQMPELSVCDICDGDDCGNSCKT